jgi:hypothetical protein
MVTIVKRDSSCVTVPTARTGRTITRVFDRFGADAAALDLIEADLDGLAVVLLLAFIDRDVVHPHPVLFRNRRGIGQAHRVAVVQDFAEAAGCCGRLLASGLERDFFILEHRKIVASRRVLLRFSRPIRRAARVAVVENLAFCRRGGALRRDTRRGHAGRDAGVPIAACRTGAQADRKKDHTSEVTHGVTWLHER